MNIRKINEELKQFCGNSPLYAHFTGHFFTPGVKFLWDNYNCRWLIEHILLINRSSVSLENSFQVWTLVRQFNKEASTYHFTLLQADGNNNIQSTTSITHSQLQFDVLVLWFENNILKLPSEQ